MRYVIIHGTWMRDDKEALERLCDPVAEVSAHYYITRAGEVIQMVPEGRIAYHAGKSEWEDPETGYVSGLNASSIGIEIGNAGPFLLPPDASGEIDSSHIVWAKAEPYTGQQYKALIELLRDILARNPFISPRRVLGHSDVSPGRKSDPGLHFDWQQLVDAEVCERPVL